MLQNLLDDDHFRLAVSSLIKLEARMVQEQRVLDTLRFKAQGVAEPAYIYKCALLVQDTQMCSLRRKLKEQQQICLNEYRRIMEEGGNV